MNKSPAPKSTNSTYTRVDFYDLVRKAITTPVQKPAPKAK